MPDGGRPALDLAQGLEEGRLAGFAAEGQPLVELEGGERLEARSLVPLRLLDLGRALALGRLGGVPLVLGLVQPPGFGQLEDAGEVRSLEARERLELRCGPASLTLFADGRVEIRGVQILSRAEGAQRLQGASIHLN